MSDLFRREVIDKHSQKHLGDVFLSAPLSFWAITILVAVIMAGLVCVAIFGEYSRKERVTGTLTPSDGLVRILPSQPGNFEDVYVETGDVVDAGTPLLKIKDDTVLTGGRQLSDALLSQMKDERESLRNRLVEIPIEYRLSQDRLETRKYDLEAEAERFVEQIEVQTRTVILEENIFRKFETLLKEEAASSIEVSSSENRYLSAKQNLISLKNSREKILADGKDLEAQLAMLPVEQAQAERDVKNRLSNLEQDILRTDAGGSSILRAPIDGSIATVTARKGQKASPQRTAMAILPKGGRLQAELLVPTRAIGFVKTGQPVRLLYDAFPYQKFGFYDGTITEVSKTVVSGNDLEIVRQLPEPVFLVTVDLDEQSIEALGQDVPLQAGMSLSADLILEGRKIWEWAFEPLLRALK